MNKLIISLLFISGMAYSQREVAVGSFSKIIVSDQIDVVLINTNDAPKVVLNGSGSEDVEVIQKGFELKIRMPLLKTLKGDDVSATVFYKGEINQFEVNEGSRIASNDLFKGQSLRFIAKEGSEIKLKVEADKVNARSGSGANISLSGNAKSQEVVTNTGGVYNAKELLSAHVKINSNAGGNAGIHATESVDVKILAGGVISVYGDPKKVSQKITGGGRLEQLK